MAKKRSRRPATPAQMAARARFAAMVKSGKFGKKKSKKKAKKAKAAKRRAHKKHARRMRRNDESALGLLPQVKAAKKSAKKAPKKPAKKPAKKAAKKASKKKAPKKSKKKASRKRSSKKADETKAFMAEAREGERRARAPKRAAKKRAAAKRRAARAKNAPAIKKVSSSIERLKKALAKSKGKKGIAKKRRIQRTRKAALSLKRSALSQSMSASERKMLEASGLMSVRANPGFADVFKDFASMLPQVGAQVVGLAAAAVAGQKIGDMVAAKMPASMPGRDFIAKNAVTIGTVGVAIAAYEAMKHASPKTRPFAGAVLMGGLAAAFVHAAARASWGSKIGLPIGAALPAAPAPALKGFVDIGGREVAVDGLGEYMALSGSTLTGSTLGEIGQMSEGRQGARALNSPGDPTVESFFDDEEDDDDEGSLSGSIFDD